MNPPVFLIKRSAPLSKSVFYVQTSKSVHEIIYFSYILCILPFCLLMIRLRGVKSGWNYYERRQTIKRDNKKKHCYHIMPIHVYVIVHKPT